MYQGTTPLNVFTIKGYNLTSAKVYVTFKQNNKLLLTKETGNGVSVSYDAEEQISTIVCSLSQEETLAMKKGSVKVQVRFIYENGDAYATNKAPISVDDILWPVVIEYGGDA